MGLLQNELVLLSFVATFSGVLGEYCYNLNTGHGQYCSYGCCGYLDRDCCSANVALIVGMIVLAILIVSTIIAVICCCVRRRAAAGQVIQTNPSAGLVVTSTQQATAGQPMPYYAPQPGAYPPPQPGAYPPPQPGTYPPQPYPTGPQPAPAYSYGAPGAQPTPGLASAPAPPPYVEETGGNVNPGYKY